MTSNNRDDRRATIQARASALAGGQARARTVRSEATAAGDTAAPSTAELWLYGVVGGYWFGFNSESVADALRGLDVEQITVRLHSPGGNAIDGIAIGNLLRNHKATVTVVVDGLAASAASVIALAGDEVVMSPGSQMMLHDPWILTVGNAAELRSDASFLDKQAENYAGVYAHRGKGSAADWRQAMLADDGRGTWYTAQEAVDAGLADRVGTVTSSNPPPADPAEGSALSNDEMAARAAWDLEVLVHPAARAAWSGPKPPTESSGGSITTEGGTAVADFSNEQITNIRGLLGLAEDADEDAVNAAIDRVTDQVTTPTPPAATVPEGSVIVEAEVLTSLRAGAEAGLQAQRQLAAQKRDQAIDAAITAGKTTPARREHWVKAYDADPEGAQAQLDALEPGLAVPTAELGHDNPVSEHNAEDDAAYNALFSDETKEA